MGGFLERPRWQLGICLLVGLALRAPLFGDPYIHVDEAFYFLVGQEMHHGAIPFVDIWDRKPVGLFLLYYLIGGISRSVWSYQIAAWLFASGTAFTVCRIAMLWAKPRAAVLGGIAYLSGALIVDGVGGQAPIFYNLPMAIAAWCVASSLGDLESGRVPRKVYVAMALCGIAITIKQTTLFESLFFGAFSLVALWRSEAPRQSVLRFALIAATLGAVPTVATALFYAGIGHWHDFWQAMVVSNLSKPRPEGLLIYIRAVVLLIILGPLWFAAFCGMFFLESVSGFDPYRRFMKGWIAAALLGFVSVPNFYYHYGLPLLVPFGVAAATFYARPIIGTAMLTLLVGYSIYRIHLYDFSRWAQARWRMDDLASAIRQHDLGRGLLVFDGPPSLYFMTGNHPMSPLAFPHHLHHAIDRNVSQFDTATEIRRIITKRPGAVVLEPKIINVPTNFDSRMVVMEYVARRCRFIDGQIIPMQLRKETVVVFGDCR